MSGEHDPLPPIVPVYSLTDVGEPVPICEGSFDLRVSANCGSSHEQYDDPEITVSIQGHMSFELFPDPHLSFRFHTTDTKIGRRAFPSDESKFELKLPGSNSFVDVDITRVYESDSGQDIQGTFASNKAKSSDEYSEIMFHLINCRGGSGNKIIEYLTENGKVLSNNRINLETDDGWSIDIDARRDLDDIWRRTVRQKSYSVTHIGRIRHSQNTCFNRSKAIETLRDLYWFLSFAMASPVGIGLMVGVKSDGNTEIIFEDCTIVFPADDRQTWYPKNYPANLDQMFRDFCSTLRDKHWSNSLPSLISSYTSSNSGYIESRITTICSAFETIAWIHLVNEREWITSDGYGKLPAGDALRLLLSLSSISIECPIGLPHLAAKAKELGKKAPDLIFWVRNRIVHPDKNEELTTDLKIETSTLATSFLELIMLHLFRYEGQYMDRVEWEPKPVPWLNENEET